MIFPIALTRRAAGVHSAVPADNGNPFDMRDRPAPLVFHGAVEHDSAKLPETVRANVILMLFPRSDFTPAISRFRAGVVGIFLRKLLDRPLAKPSALPVDAIMGRRGTLNEGENEPSDFASTISSAFVV